MSLTNRAQNDLTMINEKYRETTFCIINFITTMNTLMMTCQSIELELLTNVFQVKNQH